MMLKHLADRCLTAASAGKTSTARYVWPAAWLRHEEPAAAASLSMDLRQLMMRVGRIVFDTCLTHYPRARHWLIVIGTGNNAGDGLEVAQHCRTHGIAVTVWAMTLKPGSHYPSECAAAMQAWQAMSGTCTMLPYSANDTEAFVQSAQAVPDDVDLVVDALLGTGARGAPRGSYVPVIQRLNALPVPRVSVDIPSGLDAETGEVFHPSDDSSSSSSSNSVCCISAQLTVTFITLKPGLLLGNGKSYTGQLCYDNVGLGEYLQHSHRMKHAIMQRLSNRDLARYFGSPRPREAHKGSQGSVILVGGGEAEHAGAVMMAAEAAVCTGAGLTRVLTAEGHQTGLLARCPEAMVYCVPPNRDNQNSGNSAGDAHISNIRAPSSELYTDEATATEYIYEWLHSFVAAAHAETTSRSTATSTRNKAAGLVLAVGPGLGTRCFGRSTFAALRRLLTAYPQTRIVLDADALNLLAASAATHASVDTNNNQNNDDGGKRSNDQIGVLSLPLLPNSIITPHPGEAARLLRCSVAEVEADRLDAARRLAAILGGTCILKGAGTLVYRHTSSSTTQHTTTTTTTTSATNHNDNSGDSSNTFTSTPESKLHWTNCAYIDAGNPGMATGGMGDVLTGVTAAAAAQMQQVDMFEVACAAALVHSVAADLVAEATPGRGTRGVRPTELFRGIQQCINVSAESLKQ